MTKHIKKIIQDESKQERIIHALYHAINLLRASDLYCDAEDVLRVAGLNEDKYS